MNVYVLSDVERGIFITKLREEWRLYQNPVFSFTKKMNSLSVRKVSWKISQIIIIRTGKKAVLVKIKIVHVLILFLN